AARVPEVERLVLGPRPVGVLGVGEDLVDVRDALQHLDLADSRAEPVRVHAEHDDHGHGHQEHEEQSEGQSLLEAGHIRTPRPTGGPRSGRAHGCSSYEPVAGLGGALWSRPRISRIGASASRASFTRFSGSAPVNRRSVKTPPTNQRHIPTTKKVIAKSRYTRTSWPSGGGITIPLAPPAKAV